MMSTRSHRFFVFWLYLLISTITIQCNCGNLKRPRRSTTKRPISDVKYANLHLAVEKGDQLAVEQLLNEDPSLINKQDPLGDTPLHVAAKNGNQALVKLLLAQKGIQLNILNNNQQTAFDLLPNSSPIRSLLDEATNGRKEGKLQNAILAGDVGQMQELIREDPNLVNSRDGSGNTPLFTAVNQNNVEAVRLLVNSPGIDVKDTNGTLLDKAIANKNMDIVKLLLEKSPDFDDEGPNNGSKHVFEAIENDDNALLDLLLTKNPDINAMSNDAVTPLSLAIEKDNLKMVDSLLAKNPDINAKSEDGVTPLSLAIGKKNLEMVKSFLAKNPDLDIMSRSSSREGWWVTPLFQASESGDTEIVRLLLQHGATNDRKNGHKGVPIHTAIRHEHKEVVELLLDSGAGVDDKDYTDKENTPLHIAARTGNKEIINLLLGKGADKTIRNNEGQLPADLAPSQEIKDLLT